MGRITIFSLTECPHCNRTKAKLKELGVPYDEVNLSLYPNRRNDMLSLTDRLTVPQVFFNEEHIGGADDTMAKISEIGAPNFKAYYESNIKECDDPPETRLQIPTEPPVPEKPAPPRDEAKSLKLPGGAEKTTVLDMMTRLQDILEIKDRKHNLTIYSNCFVGREAVTAFKKAFPDIQSDNEAVMFGRYLQKSKIIHHVVENHDFKNETLYFRLQCHHTPEVLNSYRIWQERVDEDSMSLLKRLKKQLGKVETAATDKDGLVNYKEARTSDKFAIFEEAVCELQGVAMDKMGADMKLAFGINLYNLMIKYAFMKVGIGQTTLARGAFFSGVKMNVGGDILSFNDLENGVLRGNRKPPYSLSAPFASDDKRGRLAMETADCRIHFALNCGAKSCPPVKSFSTQAIEEELRIVAQAFCEQDDNVRMNPAKNVLHLTKILDWYRVDFADSKGDLPEKIVEFLRGSRKDTLMKMIESGKAVSVSYNTYDWGTNASQCDSFDPSRLKANRTTVRALF